MDNTTRKFRNEFNPYYDSGVVESNCNAITFINRGAQNAFINGYPLNVGEQLCLEGLEGEMDKTIYQISFTPGQTGDKYIFAIRKVYVE